MEQDAGQHKWSGHRFSWISAIRGAALSPEQQARFRREYWVKSLGHLRVVFLFAALCIALLGLQRTGLPSPAERHLALLRYGLVCPALAALFGLSFAGRFAAFLEASVSLVLLLCGGVLVAGFLLDRQAWLGATLDMIVGLMALFTLLRLRFSVALGVSMVLCGAYTAATLFAHPASSVLLRSCLAAVLTTQLVGVGAGWSLEAYARREFALTCLLEAEHERSERLLNNTLPAPIAARLKREPGTIADSFAEVSVLFADVVGFTPLAESMAPLELVELLNRIYARFDALAERHGLEKIKTMGDSYMAASGLPYPRPDHAHAAAEMALDMQQAISQFRVRGEPLALRVGINSGPVVAGVIGTRKFSYDLWGDTVNVACRMESHADAGTIQVAAATYPHLADAYDLWPLGPMSLKGHGVVETFRLAGRRQTRPEAGGEDGRHPSPTSS